MAISWKNQYSKYKDFFLNVYDSYKKKEESRMFMEILLSLCVTAFFVFLALRPTVLTILDLLKTIEEKERIVSVMDEKIANLDSAKQLYSRNTIAANIAKVAVPDRPSPDTFARQVLGLAQQTGVDLGGVSIDEVVLSGTIVDQSDIELGKLPQEAYPMSFSLNLDSPSFNSLKNILSNIKSLRIPVSLDSYSLTATNEEGVFNLTLSVGGRSPYLGENKPE